MIFTENTVDNLNNQETVMEESEELIIPSKLVKFRTLKNEIHIFTFFIFHLNSIQERKVMLSGGVFAISAIAINANSTLHSQMV